MTVRHIAAATTLAAAVILLQVGGTGYARPASNMHPSRTRVVHVKPFLASGALAPGYKVIARVAGNCWTNSNATTRPDAFRCMRVNEIYDPCFRNPAGSRVACPLAVAPWQVVIMRPTKKLPHAQMAGHPESWLLKLANGAVCQLDTGASFLVNGKRANFACTDKSWLFGRADTHRQPWLIERGFGTHPRLKLAAVATAWF